MFTKLSKWMRTRDSEQCRSHHQKLLHYHHSIKGIISHFEEVIFARIEKAKESQAQKVIKERQEIEEKKVQSPFYTLNMVNGGLSISIDVGRIEVYSF